MISCSRLVPSSISPSVSLNARPAGPADLADDPPEVAEKAVVAHVAPDDVLADDVVQLAGQDGARLGGQVLGREAVIPHGRLDLQRIARDEAMLEEVLEGLGDLAVVIRQLEDEG